MHDASAGAPLQAIVSLTWSLVEAPVAESCEHVLPCLPRCDGCRRRAARCHGQRKRHPSPERLTVCGLFETPNLLMLIEAERAPEADGVKVDAYGATSTRRNARTAII